VQSLRWRTAGLSRDARRGRRPLLLAAALAASLLAVLGCRGETVAAPLAAVPDPAQEGPLTVFSGLDEEVLAPLLAEFQSSSGSAVVVRHGETAELVSTLREEGTRTSVDLLLAREAAALGELSRFAMLREVPIDLARQVPPPFSGAEQKHDWVGLTGRARAVVYDPLAIAAEELPRTLLAVADPRHRGRFALAPQSASFRAQMAAQWVRGGEEALDLLLAGVRDNQPRLLASDAEVVRAVESGESAWGLVDHTALRGEVDAGGVRLVVLSEDGAAFVDAAGAGLLSDDPRALALLRFLLSPGAQRQLAAATGEYPLVTGVAAPDDLPPLDSLHPPAADFADVAAVLDETARAIRRAGLSAPE
jgi:iron(III) transport system substrate-binding protein